MTPGGGTTRWAAAALIALAAALSSVSAQAPPALSESEARAVAAEAIRQGDPRIAAEIAAALLERDPADADAHLLVAAAARLAQRLDLAARAAGEAWQNASSPRQRFDAAFLAADVAARRGRWNAAQLWLRRADEHAPDPKARAAVARAYRAVDRRNPLDVRLSFALRPSDNLNNGWDPDETVFGSTERKVGGIEISAGATLSYRLAESDTSLTRGFAQVFLRRAILEDGFRDRVPDATRHEYDYASLSLGVEHRFRTLPRHGPASVTFAAGSSYYRNGHLANFYLLGVAQDFRIDGATLRAGARLRDERRFDTPVASSVSRSLSLDWFDRTDSGTTFSLGASVTDHDSRALTVDGRSAELRGSVGLGRTVAGLRPDLGASLTWRELPRFDDSLFGGGRGRTDRTARVTLGLTFAELSWYGFLPRLELSGTLTDSNRDLWDRESLSLGATFVSRY